MFIYDDEKMTWTASWLLAFAGYYASDNIKEGYDVQQWVALDKNGYSAYPFGLDKVKGNIGKEGYWCFKVNNKRSTNKAKSCIDWHLAQPSFANQVDKVAQDCPCTLQQAVLDRRYRWNSNDWLVRLCIRVKVNRGEKIDSCPLTKKHYCVSSTGPQLLRIDNKAIESQNGNPIRYYHRCCYEVPTGDLIKDSELGLLTVTHITDQYPSSHSFTTKYMRSEMKIQDSRGFNYCCQDTDLCDKFFERRSIPTCINYTVPDRCKEFHILVPILTYAVVW